MYEAVNSLKQTQTSPISKTTDSLKLHCLASCLKNRQSNNLWL